MALWQAKEIATFDLDADRHVHLESPKHQCDSKMALELRSRMPFTGVLTRSAFRVILGTCLGVPQRVLFERFLLAFFSPQKCQKALEKHSLGHSEAGAQNHSKSTPWGTFRPGPLSTPVNGIRDRNSRVKSDFLGLAISGIVRSSQNPYLSLSLSLYLLSLSLSVSVSLYTYIYIYLSLSLSRHLSLRCLRKDMT